MCLDVKDAIEAAGILRGEVSSGETFSYDIAATMPGVTEVEGGTYMLMSHGFDYMTEFRIAAKVLATIISTPRPGIAIGDVGSRALALRVWPAIDGMPKGSPWRPFTKSTSCYAWKVRRGWRSATSCVFLVSGQQDFMTDRWDQYIAVRDGVVEAVWDILARGCYH